MFPQFPLLDLIMNMFCLNNILLLVKVPKLCNAPLLRMIRELARNICEYRFVHISKYQKIRETDSLDYQTSRQMQTRLNTSAESLYHILINLPTNKIYRKNKERGENMPRGGVSSTDFNKLFQVVFLFLL